MNARKRIPIFALTTGLLACPRVSAVLRHPDMTDAQAIAIAELPQFQSRARISGCSAAMLNSEWMISAAHCTNYAAESRVNATYSIGGTTYSRDATAYRVTINEPGVDDVLLVHLDSPIPQAGSWVAPYDGFDEFDRLGWKLGYGWSGALSNPVQVGGTCRGMTQFLRSTVREGRGESSVVPQFLFYNYNGSPAASPPSEFTTLYEGGTGPGDSGGPMYIHSRGRFFNASVTSGPDNGDYRDGRLSTHLAAMVSRLGFSFAYPQPLEVAGTWTAQDLAGSITNLDPVDSWFDTKGEHAWSRFSDGGSGAPLWIENATPTGLAALRFDGDDAMGLPASANPFADGTALSVVMVIRPDNAGGGNEATPFGTTGLLDASDTTNGWGLSFSPSGRCGIGVEDRNGAVESIFRGDTGNASLADGDWHVVVATWDGSEIPADNAGDDRNLKLYVDSAANRATGQAASHFAVARGAASLLLGDSQTNGLAGFSGDIAEIRMFRGELQEHEVDRLMDAMRDRHISGAPGMDFLRPWSGHLALPAGQSLSIRGILTGGGTEVAWSTAAGPASAVFSDAASPETEVTFPVPGSYTLRATVTNGSVSGFTDLSMDVRVPDETAASPTLHAVPGNWIHADIGAPAAAGSMVEIPGGFTLHGAGAGTGIGEGGTYDQGSFAWKGVAGDFDLTTRIIPPASGFAGLMLRGGPGPTDAAVFAGIAADGTGVLMHRRGGGFWSTAVSLSGGATPAWLKLECRNGEVTAFRSDDGTGYSPLGAALPVSLPGVRRAGMFVSSGSGGTLATASFEAVSLQQVGAAALTTVRIGDDFSTGDTFEFVPAAEGTDEPWVSASIESGPATPDFTRSYRDRSQVFRTSTPAGGSYRARIAADDGNALTSIETSHEVFHHTRYEFDGGTDGWAGVNVTGLASVSGSLVGSASTNDPQVTRGGLSLSGTLHDHVIVRLRTPAANPVQLYWATAANPGFTAGRSMIASYTDAGFYQTITFDLTNTPGWTGETITNLRFDPLNGTVAGTDFAIDFIEISDGRQWTNHAAVWRFDDDGDFDGWDTPKDITGAYVLAGSLSGETSGGDPILRNNDAAFEADDAANLLVRIRSDAAGTLQVFWGTTINAGYAAARSASAPMPGGAAWNTVLVPLAGHPEWDGRSIRGIRLDPGQVSGSAFSVDTICFSSGDADTDGMPDDFEQAAGLDALDGADASQDPDGDGLTSLAEFIAGTDPMDAFAKPRSTITRVPGDELRIETPGLAGRVYQLQESGALGPPWQVVETTGPFVSDSTVSFERPIDGAKGFFRIVIRMP